MGAVFFRSELDKEKREKSEEEKIEIRDKENQGREQVWSEVKLTVRDAQAHTVRNKEDDRGTGWERGR